MEGHQFYIELEEGKVEYLEFGQGDQLLICIHGFSDSAALFRHIAPAWIESHTVVSFSLPFHGGTEWIPSRFSSRNIHKIIMSILDKYQQERFTLLGYSMGGKISLYCTQKYFADKLDRLILCASDGLKTHILYDVSKLPRWFVESIKLLMRFPKLMFLLVGFSYRRGLLSKFLYDFFMNHFETKAQRRRFFGVATSSRFMKPDLSIVSKMINDRKIPVDMYFGERDEVIILDGAKDFASQIDNVRFHQLSKGHLLIDEDLCELMKEEKLKLNN
ncbi:alpha/beta fold hydrolase [Flammeovirga yaeyamensis]|uniref:Alpha/beta fold hydrolase n=1 Tax=Flammeovirga yaeyamensis TaxID=367791 RepID=A0AAX1N7Z0_9BACT|nr:alpha/beta hydrolase [Flammeovirga yaeyamensis]MBB3699604.1 pimeloyl-ACP methyl ester carboxylesterase [Flammeovirga yaeyamensis]NMF36823.1 alpha/beta hydrolase [Flammeovirga yaeyamensis]QWG02137.1 alpha/beta fold hydrolase [Flammeovirga yaeyamensis]